MKTPDNQLTNSLSTMLNLVPSSKVSNFKLYLRKIWFLMGDDRKRLPFLLLFFLGISVVDIVSIGIVGPYISLVVNHESYQNLPSILQFSAAETSDRSLLTMIFGVTLVLTFLIKTIAAIIMNRTIFQFSLGRAAQLRTELMDAYMCMPYEDYLNRNSAQMLQTVQDYVSQFVEQSVIPLLRLISEGIIVITILGFLAWAHGYALSLLILLITPVAIIYDKFFNSRVLIYGEKANLKMSRLLKALKEATSGLKELRVLGATEYFHEIVKDSANGNSDYIVKSKTIIAAPRYILELCLILFVAILTISVSYLDGDAENVLPVLGMFGVAAMRLIPSANTCIGGISKLRVGQHATHMLYMDLNKISTKKDTARKNQNTTSKHACGTFEALIFHDVQYRYPATTINALNGVSFSLIQGESIGLIGRSGSGKTTLVDVMLGLLEPQHGEILINQLPINKCLNFWRSQVAYLPQQVFIADSSVRNNVALGIPDDQIDTAAVWIAIEQSRLSDIINSMPNGLDTVLGEHGVRLSGGQRQRIALARAIYHDRNVLVMDESTSALDAETEKEVIDAIKTLRGKKSMIVIAHRMSIIEQCDRVYRLENGQIYECIDGEFKE